MKYTFKCPQCQDSKEFEVSVKEYDEFKAVCENCKVKMERVYEVPQVKGGSSAKLDDNTFSGSDSASSCGGSCTTCAGCGV